MLPAVPRYSLQLPEFLIVALVLYSTLLRHVLSFHFYPTQTLTELGGIACANNELFQGLEW